MVFRVLVDFRGFQDLLEFRDLLGGRGRVVRVDFLELVG